MINPLKEERYYNNKEPNFSEMLKQSPIGAYEWKKDASIWLLKKHFNGEFEHNDYIKREYALHSVQGKDNLIHFIHNPEGHFLFHSYINQRRKYVLEVQEFMEKGYYFCYDVSIYKINMNKSPLDKHFLEEFFMYPWKEKEKEEARTPSINFLRGLRNLDDLEIRILDVKKAIDTESEVNRIIELGSGK
ncbi:MAG: hypothetical protein WC413_02520 [Candidatus Nanoarchaeia archaeon]